MQAWIGAQAGERIARGYLNRIRLFCRRLRHFPHRGVERSDVRPGLRIVAFESRVDIVFKVEDDRVVIVRALYAGRQFSAD